MAFAERCQRCVQVLLVLHKEAISVQNVLRGRLITHIFWFPMRPSTTCIGLDLSARQPPTVMRYMLLKPVGKCQPNSRSSVSALAKFRHGAMMLEPTLRGDGPGCDAARFVATLKPPQQRVSRVVTVCTPVVRCSPSRRVATAEVRQKGDRAVLARLSRLRPPPTHLNMQVTRGS